MQLCAIGAPALSKNALCEAMPGVNSDQNYVKEQQNEKAYLKNCRSDPHKADTPQHSELKTETKIQMAADQKRFSSTTVYAVVPLTLHTA